MNGGADADEEETLGLLPNACKVVEYLEPVMSQDLLHKFPDNSSLGFDYSQSSIWSPLVPRSYFPIDTGCFATPKKLCFGFGQEKTAARRRKSNLSMSNKKKMMTKTKKKSSKVSDSSLTPMNVSCTPFARKGWDKVLKAASKHFKKKKKRDPTAHVKLSNYMKG